MESAYSLYHRAQKALIISPHARLILTVDIASEPGRTVTLGPYGIQGRVGMISTDGYARVLVPARHLIEVIEQHDLVYTATNLVSTEPGRKAA